MSHSIRPFQPGDSGALAAITNASPEAAQWTESAYQQLLQNNYHSWVLETNTEIAGFLVTRITGDEAEILNIVIESAHRRRGLAAQLLDHAFAEFRQSGVRQVFLEVRESNTAAIAFYRAQNFTAVGNRPGYYRDPIEAALLLRKDVL